MPDKYHPLVTGWIAHEEERKKTANRNGHGTLRSAYRIRKTDAVRFASTMRHHSRLAKKRGYCTAQKLKDDANQFPGFP